MTNELAMVEGKLVVTRGELGEIRDRVEGTLMTMRTKSCTKVPNDYVTHLKLTRHSMLTILELK